MRKWLTGLIVFVLALPIIGDAQMPSTLVRMSTGSGAADSGTQRVILASNSPAASGVATEATLAALLATTSTVDPTTVRAVYTSTQTNAVLVAAPSAGNRLVIIGVWAASSVTANVSVNVGLHPTVTPTGTGSVFSHPAISTTGGGWMQLGGSSIGTGADGDALLITTGTIADGALHVVTKYLVEAIP